MPESFALPPEAMIAVIVIAILVFFVAVFAIAKGRGFKFGVKWGKKSLDMSVTEKKDTESKSSGGSGNISGVSVMNKAKTDNSNVNIHIGHSAGDSAGNKRD